MQLYNKLCKAINEHEIDELGLLPLAPDAKYLPEESSKYYPLIVVETKLGIAKADLATLLKESHQYYITVPRDNFIELEQVTRIMILLKPDDYTATNKRKQLILAGHIDISKELQLIELIFTIPKHSKSSVAWYHRQWIYTQFPQLINIAHEFKLCTMTSILYPRNYYAWTYRYWVLSTFCHVSASIEQEYKDTCHWIATHISDYSGFQYLQNLMNMCDVEQDQHMSWLDGLIIKYPGHESLWCHRRFCSLLFLSPAYNAVQHQLVHDIINDTYLDQSLSDNVNDVLMQKEFALKFGLWQTLLEKRNGQNPAIHDEYLSVAPIPHFLDRQEVNIFI